MFFREKRLYNYGFRTVSMDIRNTLLRFFNCLVDNEYEKRFSTITSGLSAPVAKEELFESLDLDALDETESALYAAAEKTVVPDREDETAEKEDEA